MGMHFSMLQQHIKEMSFIPHMQTETLLNYNNCIYNEIYIEIIGENTYTFHTINKYTSMNKINIVLTKERIVVLPMSIEENMDKSLDELDKRALSLQKEVN